MKSVMSHSFSVVPGPTIPRSQFNRSHGHKTTFDVGKLVPIFVDEALPGDTFNLKMTAFARLATPIVPLMDNMRLSTFFFAVPLRLIWSNFKKFMGEQTNPGDSTSYIAPISEAPVGGYGELSLQDFMGLPTKIAGYEHNTFPLRAYNLIWNEWFRDENLQDSVTVDLGDGPDTVTNYVLLPRGMRKDYFASALPWPQKGDAVSLPLGTSAPITLNTAGLPFSSSAKWVGSSGVGGSTGPITFNGSFDSVRSGDSASAFYDPQGSLIADLSTATAATINVLRQAVQIQRLYERDARGGTRLTEIIRSHFGVVSPDARMQRPEYLGGGVTPINITPVPQTSSTDATSPQGKLAGFGTASAHGHGFVKSFTEHCVILGLACVDADQTYQQGLNRMWFRSTRFDFYWPALSHLGEQAVLSKELYCDGTGDDEDVFGYQERFAEYRYKPSIVTGRFRSNASTPLDYWHLARDFAARPVLNDTFISSTADVDRVIAVTTEPHMLFDSYVNLICARPMPVYSVPGQMDRF